MIPALVQQLGSTSNKTAGTTIALTTTGTVAAGNLIVALIIFDNAATASKPIVSSITKMAGETANWVLLGAARSTSTSAGAFASGEMWAIQTTVAWSAAAYTVTLDTSVTQKAVAFTEFSGVQAVLRSTVGTNYSTTTAAASAATAGTTPQVNDLALGLIFGSNVAAAQAGDNDTTGGSWSTPVGFGSTGGSGATNNFGIGQYKVLTAGSHQTLNNSATLTAGNGAIVAILQFIPEPTLTQAAYQFYADGTESGSTALAAQDAAYTADVSSGDVNLQQRTALQVTANAGFATDDYQLQWEKNASGTWTNVGPPPVALLDSYPSSEVDAYEQLYGSGSSGRIAVGQSFVGDGNPLAQAQFFLQKIGNPTGTLESRLYSGSTSDIATASIGSLLQTSTTSRSASTIPTTAAWVSFDFPESYVLVAGTPYYIVCWLTSSDVSTDRIDAGKDTSGTHIGSSRTRDTLGQWVYSPTTDFAFEVYTGSSTSSTVIAFNSANLTDGAATTNRLTGGTGSFVAGKVSEDGLVDDLAITANNYTELLYSLTLKQADLANGDTLRFRVLRNGATTGLTYTATSTINVTGTYTPPSITPRNTRVINPALQRSFTR